MMTQDEAKQLILNAWNAVWQPDLSKLFEFYDEDAEVSGFTPPKQTTWKGLDAIKAHFEEIQPIISNKSFNIRRLDLVADGTRLYAVWDAEFDLKIPGQESVMEGRGILYIEFIGKKVKVWTFYEDPTPFVEMAMKGQMAQNS